MIVFASLHSYALAAPIAPADNNTLQRIKDAYTSNDRLSFRQLVETLPADSLFKPYVDMWAFKLQQNSLNGDEEESDTNDDPLWSPGAIIPVLDANENTWPAELLRRQWLGQLARHGKWQRFEQQRSLLRYRPDQNVKCADMLLSAQQGEAIRSKIMAVISDDNRLPKTCRVLLHTLYERKAVTADMLDLRLLNLISNNQLTNSLKFVDEFSDTHWGKHIDSERLREAIFKPERYLKHRHLSRRDNDIYLAGALAKMTRNDSDEVADRMQDQYGRYLSETNLQWLWAEVGYRSALQWDKKAEHYFGFSSPKVMNLEQLEWKVRANLIDNDWRGLLQAIADLPAEEAQSDTWKYWSGRAYAASGKIETARRLWLEIAQPFTFYGKLAQEELGEVITSVPKPKFVTAQALEEAKNNKGLQRALLLYDAGLRREGFREFNLQTEQMNDSQLLAAATWANQNELYDRAIAAADRTEGDHDLYLRYLTPYKENMEAQTKSIGIDAAWVYGLIRQESRFVTIAKSGAGARGLMQIMPSTARYVARKIGLSNYTKSHLSQIDSNLLLGTSYLKMIYEKLDESPVLASAGYNAGPSRSASWQRRLGDQSMEGARFVELIPFDETRDYVKQVMSNTVAYALLLNKTSIPLKQRLGIISNPD